MKKALIVVNTVYQLIVAIQLKLTVLEECEVDLFISDTSVGTKQFAVNGRDTHIFENIEWIESLEYQRRSGKYAKSNLFHEMRFTFGRFYDVKEICHQVKGYDYLFSANMDYFAVSLYDCIKVKNPKLKLYVFEDGLSTYKSFETFIAKRKEGIEKGTYTALYKLSGYGRCLDSICGVFCFNPELFDWKKSIKKYRIPKIKKEDQKTIEILNTFFGYEQEEKFDHVKAIFFEESFYADGYRINDEKLVNTIAECIGKENLMIKLHPRNRINRFQDYTIYENTGIPWEIVYLNHNFENIEFISISSGSIIHPFIVFGDQKKVVVLQNMTDVLTNAQYGIERRIYQKYLKDKIFDQYSDIYQMPNDEQELKNYFMEVAKR